MTGPKNILLVEDESNLRRLVSEFLRGEGYTVSEAPDGPSAVAIALERGPFHLAIVDLNLPGFSGVEVCRRIVDSYPSQKLMICSAAISCDAEETLRNLGVRDFLTKPYLPDDLLATVFRLVHSPQHSDEHAVAFPRLSS